VDKNIFTIFEIWRPPGTPGQLQNYVRYRRYDASFPLQSGYAPFDCPENERTIKRCFENYTKAF
jgi:hypothetical protein